MAVTREQVLAAYAANPLAEARPSEEAIKFWQNAGLGSFDQTVAAVRASDPVLAAQIDAQRGNVAPAPAAAPAPTLFSTPAPAATPTTTAPLPENFNSSGTYLAFVDNLKNKDVDPLAAINSLNVNPEYKQAITTIYNQIIQQQKAGTSEYWGTGTLASKEGAAAEMALRLAEGGATSLTDIGTRAVEETGGTELFNKATGQPLNYNTNSGGLKLNYNIQTLPDGTVVPVATKRQSDWMKFRENVLKPGVAIALSAIGGPMIGAAVAPASSLAVQGALGGAIAGGGAAALTGGDLLTGALLGGAGGYLQGANAVPNTAGYYDEITGQFVRDPNGLLSGPLSDLTGTNINSMAGYSYDPATQTWTMPNGTQVTSPTGVTNGVVTGQDLLDNAGAGLDNFSGYYDEITGQFIPDPNGPLQGPLDNTSGTNIDSMAGYSYDPATQTWTMPDGTKVTSVTGVTNAATTGAGLLSNAGAAPSVSTTTGANMTTGGSGLTPSQIANLIKAGVSLAGVTGAARAVTGGGGSNTPLQAPTQGVPTNDPNYYNQLQQYYNAYLPQTPRDVVTPLQQWYNSSYGA